MIASAVLQTRTQRIHTRRIDIREAQRVRVRRAGVNGQTAAIQQELDLAYRPGYPLCIDGHRKFLQLRDQQGGTRRRAEQLDDCIREPRAGKARGVPGRWIISSRSRVPALQGGAGAIRTERPRSAIGINQLIDQDPRRRIPHPVRCLRPFQRDAVVVVGEPAFVRAEHQNLAIVLPVGSQERGLFARLKRVIRVERYHHQALTGRQHGAGGDRKINAAVQPPGQPIVEQVHRATRYVAEFDVLVVAVARGMIHDFIHDDACVCSGVRRVRRGLAGLPKSSAIGNAPPTRTVCLCLEIHRIGYSIRRGARQVRQVDRFAAFADAKATGDRVMKIIDLGKPAPAVSVDHGGWRNRPLIQFIRIVAEVPVGEGYRTGGGVVQLNTVVGVVLVKRRRRVVIVGMRLDFVEPYGGYRHWIGHAG